LKFSQSHRYDAILLLLLFALYIGIKIGQNNGPSAEADTNNNDFEPTEREEVEEGIEESDQSDNLMDNKYLNIVLMPLTFMFDMTMPSKMSSVIKFFISIGWLSTLSYFSVNAITDLSK